MQFRDLRVSYRTERIASDNFEMCCLEERNFRLYVNIHNLTPAITKSTFPESSVWSIRRKLELYIYILQNDTLTVQCQVKAGVICQT